MKSESQKYQSDNDQHSTGAAGPYEAALKRALADLAAAKVEQQLTDERLRNLRGRVSELVGLVQHLLSVLPDDIATHYQQTAESLLPAEQPSRGGPVYENVVELFSNSKRREWTVTGVQSALDEVGKGAEPKAVYNVLNYLARKGHLRRISRGRYHIVGLGIGIETSDELVVGSSIGGPCMDE